MENTNDISVADMLKEASKLLKDLQIREAEQRAKGITADDVLLAVQNPGLFVGMELPAKICVIEEGSPEAAKLRTAEGPRIWWEKRNSHETTD